MLDIKKVDHIGIRVHEEEPAVAFYEILGFVVKSRGDFQRGQPIIMDHPGGIAINLLGPANQAGKGNVLQDGGDVKFAGITHFALHIPSLEDAKTLFEKNRIRITETFSFGSLKALFVRDPDGNVIEFDEYEGDAPSTRVDSESMKHHP